MGILNSVLGEIGLSSLTLFLLSGVTLAVHNLYQQQRSRKAYPLPPGPRGWPIIGNALDIPLTGLAPVYAAWGKQFGSDVVSASALGTTVVAINSYGAAIELLEKRAAKYSCRPVSVMACDLMGWNSIFVLNPYSEKWRERRKLFVQYFRPTDAVHVPRVYEFVHRLLLDLHETPKEVRALTRHMVGCLSISLAYGFSLQRRRDELVTFVDSIVRMISKQVTPGNAIVDVIPWLKYIPAWLPGFNGMEWLPTPGMGFKRFAKSVRWKSERFKMEPYERAVKAFGTEGARTSFLSDALARLEAEVEDEEARNQGLDAILDVAATIFATAGDTTTNALHTLIFAVATHAQIRKQIQDELDSVLLEIEPSNPTGKRSLRLPTFEDQPRLPYLMAAVMESQRWAPVTPTGVPHATTEDDIYKGYFIPKGSVILPNHWLMLNDENEYGVDVLEYRPDRFLRSKGAENCAVEINPDVRHPNTIAFGFGRRACPGSHIAESTLWLTVACLLTLFDFNTPNTGNMNYLNKQGKVGNAFDPTFLCRPNEFECEFTLRSEEARVLIEELRMQVA